ncbi:MAG: hypothetical protein Q3982_05130 [Phoenicibacter congonensis]|uniref:Uncharacterized protein n=1 Tax=Phoenicibacter congonensis TaxID=1944646 RepID=A0AA43RM54_9ACTN|nr:hypothetical protein [Phoenicibacter congonensis]
MTVNYSGNNTPQPKRTRDEIVRDYERKNEYRARTARARTNEVMTQHRESAARATERRARQHALDEMRREEEIMSAKRREQQRDREASNARMDAGLNMERTKNASRLTVSRPLSSKEFQANTIKSREQYERERASRDALNDQRVRTKERTVIDGRGTIDSRTFNESQEISSVTNDERDQHDPMITTTESNRRWNTRSNSVPSREPRLMSSSDQNGMLEPGFLGTLQSLPPFVKIAIPIILVLLIIVLILLFI